MSGTMYGVAQLRKKRSRQRIQLRKFSYDTSTRPLQIFDEFKCVVYLSTAFGVMPLKIFNRKKKFLFSWLSLRSIYSFLVILSTAFVMGLRWSRLFAIMDRKETRVVTTLLARILFCTMSALILILFLRIGRKFPELMEFWIEINKQMEDYNYPHKNLFRFRYLIPFVTFSFIFSALLENFLSMVGKCTLGNSTFWEFIHCYCTIYQTSEIAELGYSDLFGLFLTVVNKYDTFAWNFMDLFLIIISISLSREFDRYNNGYSKVDITAWTSVDWERARLDHLKLVILVEKVDKIVSPLVLTSYINNVFFVCYQLFSNIKPSTGFFLDKIYVGWSFFHLMARLILVSLLAARINEQSKAALKYTRYCPKEKFCFEVSRFESQLREEVGLTGMRFFILNRSFVLAIFSVIVSYEIILHQFSTHDD